MPASLNDVSPLFSVLCGAIRVVKLFQTYAGQPIEWGGAFGIDFCRRLQCGYSFVRTAQVCESEPEMVMCREELQVLVKCLEGIIRSFFKVSLSQMNSCYAIECPRIGRPFLKRFTK